ncbi:thioredoxin family protein [Agrobacterium tumefaciens]|uniref:thioredoxin family protein n=1 Tax=Agrobacterium tumefaciens TaxID=358 RepID=UPI0021D15D87|nr:thioredoxin family protein [Agrobacterium tumefaciens]UXS05405.1 thioredoxin fold domain-containing protein [Agrobacterium tumefaciens]
MFLAFLWRSVAILLLLMMPTAASNKPLPVEEAFRLSLNKNGDGRIVLNWDIEQGYYLCRDHLQVRDVDMGTDLFLQKSPTRSLTNFSMATSTQDAQGGVIFSSIDDLNELSFAVATSKDKPTSVYFTADWCVTCRTIEENVLSERDVITVAGRFEPLKIDLTELSDAKKRLMTELSVVGLPTMILFESNGLEKTVTRLVGDMAKSLLSTSLSEVK